MLTFEEFLFCFVFYFVLLTGNMADVSHRTVMAGVSSAEGQDLKRTY
jgi:hypothetical protein